MFSYSFSWKRQPFTLFPLAIIFIQHFHVYFTVVLAALCSYYALRSHISQHGSSSHRAARNIIAHVCSVFSKRLGTPAPWCPKQVMFIAHILPFAFVITPECNVLPFIDENHSCVTVHWLVMTQNDNSTAPEVSISCSLCSKLLSVCYIGSII